MIHLARLLDRLESGDSPRHALAAYLRAAPSEDVAQALALLSGRRPRRIVPLAALRQEVCAATATPDWLFADCIAVAGSVAEALANLLPRPVAPADPALHTMLARLRGTGAAELPGLLAPLTPAARLLAIRLATGTFRTMLPAPVIARAVAEVSGADPAAVTLRLPEWDPAAGLAALTDRETSPHTPRAFPAIVSFPGPRGEAAAWAAFPRAGTRLQLVRRAGAGHVWAEDGRLLTPDLPAVAQAMQGLPPGTVAEGLADGRGGLVLLDLLEWQGQGLGALGFDDRRALLRPICTGPLTLARPLDAAHWEELSQERAASGLWLRRRDAPPGAPWHDWPPAGRETDALLVHAELAPGGRGIVALTFALRAGNALVPVARTTEGLDPGELAELADWIRAHATARFGPVRELPPTRLYRLGYAAADPAPRRKAGLWLRGARILRHLPDRTPDRVATLDSVTLPGA